MNVIRIATLPESRNMRDHEARIHLPHRRVIETPLLISARLRTFHPDVRARDELDEQIASAWLGKVERDAKHVAPFLDPRSRDRRLAVFARQPDSDIAPSHVARSGPLYLDHLRAHFRRELGGKRLRDQGPGGNDLHTLQRSERFRHKIRNAHLFSRSGMKNLPPEKLTPKITRAMMPFFAGD